MCSRKSPPRSQLHVAPIFFLSCKITQPQEFGPCVLGVLANTFFVFTFCVRKRASGYSLSCLDPKNVFVNRMQDLSARNVNMCPQLPDRERRSAGQNAAAEVPLAGAAIEGNLCEKMMLGGGI